MRDIDNQKNLAINMVNPAGGIKGFYDDSGPNNNKSAAIRFMEKNLMVKIRIFNLMKVTNANGQFRCTMSLMAGTLYQLALLSRVVENYENFKLECSWAGEPTNSL